MIPGLRLTTMTNYTSGSSLTGEATGDLLDTEQASCLFGDRFLIYPAHVLQIDPQWLAQKGGNFFE